MDTVLSFLFGAITENGVSWYIVLSGFVTLLFLVAFWSISNEGSSVANKICGQVESYYEGHEASVYSLKGRRKYMEDTFRAEDDLLNDGQVSYYAVYDGHGGHRAADYAANRLHINIKNELNDIRKQDLHTKTANIPHALSSGFRKLDEEFLQTAKMHKWSDGTTAVAALVFGQKSRNERRFLEPAKFSCESLKRKTGAHLYVANTGDSRCILVTGGRALPLSEDQKPNRRDERSRIEAKGGRVLHSGAWRVEGILAVSRAIGDLYLKAWVIPDPEVQHRELTTEDSALILATDGVWDVLSNQEVADICNASLERSGGTTKQKLDILARQITKKAFDRGSLDNITTLVVDLQAFKTGVSEHVNC